MDDVKQHTHTWGMWQGRVECVECNEQPDPAELLKAWLAHEEGPRCPYCSEVMFGCAHCSSLGDYA